MKTFSQWLENRVFRIDPEQRDFANQANLRHYFFLQKDQEGQSSGSGPITPGAELPNWAKGRQGATRQGLFTGRYKDIVSYMVPRDVPWVIVQSNPKPTIYFNQSDLPKINAYKPWISSFDSSGFEALPDTGGPGEYFSEKPGTPLKQKQIENPLNKIKSQFNVQIVNNIRDLVNDLNTRGINYTAEGLPDLTWDK